MKQVQTNSYLETQGVPSLMAKYALPCIISLLVGALYNIVDQIFIANANYLGSYGNAANSVVFPLTVIALAIATMIGDGCCSYGRRLPGLHSEASIALTSSFNLPAPGRCHTLYFPFQVCRVLCFC